MPGQFTGTTGVKPLSHKELQGYGNAWAKKVSWLLCIDASLMQHCTYAGLSLSLTTALVVSFLCQIVSPCASC
jgi:hypothetical protein